MKQLSKFILLLLCSTIALSGRSQTPYRVSIEAIPWLIFPDAAAAYLPLFGINYGDNVNSLQILCGKSVKPRKRSLYSSIDQALTIDNTLEADDYFLHWTTSSIELPNLIDTATATYTLTLWLEEGKVQVLTLRRQR